MFVNNNSGVPPAYGPQQSGYPQPVTYRPQQPGYYPQDRYQPNRPPTGPGMPGAPPQEEYKYIAQKDVAFGIAGAAAGYFLIPMLFACTGPIGAIIGGLAFLIISAITRAVKHGQEKKQLEQQQQQQQPMPMPNPPQYPPSANGQRGPQNTGYNYQIQYDYGQNKNGYPPGQVPPQYRQ